MLIYQKKVVTLQRQIKNLTIMESKKMVEIPLNQKHFIEGILCIAIEDSPRKTTDGCHKCVFIRGNVACRFLACSRTERTDGKFCHFERVFNN